MFKDYDKYLSASLRVYIFVLVIIVILKIVGLDYFGIDVNNPFICKLNDILMSNRMLLIICDLSMLFMQFYFYICIVCKKRKLYLEAFVGSVINITSQIIMMEHSQMHTLYYILCCLITIVLPMIVNKKFMIKRQILYIGLITLYQLISLLIRNISVHYEYGNFVIDAIMNLDQLLILAVNYTLYFMKKEGLRCQEQEVGLSSQKKTNLKTSLKNLQTNYLNFKKQDKENKLAIIIYFILSLIWNIFTVFVVLFIAKLNGTFIECIFILTSFWLSKRVFGKAFHLSSMLHCFIVSNLTYYFLNRITTPLGISILVPIMLGVGLSYVTSKLVKKTYKPLYKGMPEDLFEETILKVVDKDSEKYKICYDFYINKKTELSLSFEYNYSIEGIKKIKRRINNKIKEL